MGIASLMVLVAVGIIVLLKSERFRTYILHTAQRKASEALGTETRLKDFALSWSGAGPVIGVRDLVVHGAEPYHDPPFLEARNIQVRVTISSLWHQSWYLDDVSIDHPVVHVMTDKQGRTNLPKSKTDTSGTKTDVFELGIRRVKLTDGEIYYNDQKAQLSADVRDLAFQSAFDPSQKKYSGELSYNDGRVRLQGAAPLAHSVKVNFQATPQKFTLENALLRAANSQLALRGTVENYAQPTIRAAYEGFIQGMDIKKTTAIASIPSGLIRIAGQLELESKPNESFLRSAAVRGTVHSDALALNVGDTGLKLQRVGANYILEQGSLLVERITAQILGGTLGARLATRNIDRSPKSSLTASVKGVSTSAIQELAGAASQNRPVLEGVLNADADATWGKNTDDLSARTEAVIDAALVRGGNRTPITGLIRSRYDAPRELLSIRQSYVRTPLTNVALDGTVSQHSSLQVRVDANELHEIEDLIQAFRGDNAAPLGLYGQAVLASTITGPPKRPRISARLSATNVKLRGTAWKTASAQIAAEPQAVRVAQAEFVPATQGRIVFRGKSTLREWRITESTPFEVWMDASNVNAAEIARAAGFSKPVAGTLRVNVEARGTQSAPVGSGKVELVRARISNLPIHSATVRFNANGRAVAAKLRADLAPGPINGDFEYEPAGGRYRANLSAAELKLDQLGLAPAQDMELRGSLRLSASGEGTVDNPGLQASFEIPRLEVKSQVIQGLKLDVNVANHIATAALNSQMMGTTARGNGRVQLTGDYLTEAKFDTGSIALQPLVAIYAPSQANDLSGQTEVHATLQGPLKRKSELVARVVIPRLGLKYKETIELAAEGPIQADYARGILDVQRAVIKGTGTELTFQAHIPATKDATASLLLQGTVDLTLAQLLDPNITSGGQLRFDVNSYGQRSDPNIQGQIRIVDANFAQAGTPLGMRAGNGTLTLTRNRLDITEFQAKVGGGTVRGRGGVVYRPGVHFDLGLDASGVRLLYEDSVRATMDSTLALTGNLDDAMLRGQVNVEQVSFTSNFDLMDFMSHFGGGEATPPPQGGFADKVRLEVGVQTSANVNLTSRNLSLAGSAALRVRGTAAQPILLGRVNLTRGDLIFAGNRYVVQGGTIDFRNPARTEPIVDISTNTTIEQYNIRMHFWGPADHLHTNYSSDPALPPSDIINLIAFGKTTEAAATNPTPAGSLGAQSLIASQVSSQVTSRVAKLAGISQLSIDPVLGSGQQSPGARIAIQQRVTSKVFVTFATDVTSTQQQAVKLEYQLNRRTSFNAVRNQNGGMSFETNFRKEW